jgi:hypothetical protein
MLNDGNVHAVSPVSAPGRPLLDAEELVAAALSHAARRDFADRSFFEPLQRLIAACNCESDLGAFGRYSVRFDVLRSLNNLLEFEAIEEMRPEVLSRPIERPVFITGLPRSGTTFLHALLVQAPATAAPLSWQTVYPCPPRSGLIGQQLRQGWVEGQLRLLRLLAPELNRLHPMSATAPQECTDITSQVFQSLRYDSVYRVPSYQSWLERHGHLDAYRFHRRFLQHLDAQAPGRRWILKSPDHVFALSELRSVYPDACLVFVHRDPVRVLSSVARLTEVLRRPFARSIDLREIGRQVCASWVDGANRMIRAAASSGSILHLHYKQIVSAPLEAVGTLFRHSGLTLTEEARVRMRAWLGRMRHDHNHRHNYSLATFGLDAHVLRAQFTPYTEAFGIEPE